VQYIVHGVNSKEKLENLSHDVGIEVDIRYRNEKLVLGHDLDDTNDIFEEFLKIYDNTLFVANIKDTGIEELVIKKIKENNINNFFLLDVEFPFIIKNYKKYGSHLSTRFSEFEDLNTSINLKNKVSWLWIDTFTKLPINKTHLKDIRGFNSCLVSPSRWGRSEDIEKIVYELKKINFFPDFIMVEEEEILIWENFLN
tara:strand:+ start:198 stop:791 length:594 start_codon:yes stop_codon:yes gene_type:complete